MSLRLSLRRGLRRCPTGSCTSGPVVMPLRAASSAAARGTACAARQLRQAEAFERQVASLRRNRSAAKAAKGQPGGGMRHSSSSSRAAVPQAALEQSAGSSSLRRAVAAAAAAAAVGYGAYSAFGAWSLLNLATEEDYDIELPRIAEPPAHFVHPYECWPWYAKVWFAFKRSIFLVYTFAPFIRASTLMLIFHDSQSWRDCWLEQMLQCTQNAGAAFQKFGQWLSMRPDMFPPDVIRVLAKLRSDAPSHSIEVSRSTLRRQLGQDIEELFDEFEVEPVASGSVGQVHRAKLRAEYALDGPGGRLRDVAVKVQHPGVVDSAFMDLSIVWKVVEFSERFLHMTMPFDRGDFDEVIQAQMDFQREAFNLQRFEKNFKGERRIRFPKVSPRFVTPEVLVETWAHGKVISNILEDFDNATSSCKEAMSSIGEEIGEKKQDLQKKLCSILYDMSMKMMVRDNFVHGDLHGGNILYSEADNHVTVIDAGIATSLDPKTIAPFGRFLHALCSGQTDGIVKYLQRFNVAKIPANIGEFRTDIQAIMDKFMGPLCTKPGEPVNAADMFGEVMFSMQKHGMLLKGDVASTLFTISISEGLIRQLDPHFDVARRAVPYIAQHMASALAEPDL
ncbi:unnamed protein product [Polarella glacialis]|uniref:Protein kinase domain-containing protein n=2 Tax=Polarella glacialis TaxID=89957 RepID=A0A813DTT4_POLGL|nr:unnamed protein product [Polarella glacialis]